MRFYSSRDAIMLYESVITEMGRHGGTLPPGEIYHLAALATNGMLVADLWESREIFKDYAMTALMPLTAKRGVFSPEVEFCDVYKIIDSGVSFTRGAVSVAHFDGNAEELLHKYGELEKQLGFPAVPAGLVFQWSAKRPEGLCAVGHWRSREEAEQFANGVLSEALRSAAMPEPRIEYYDVYNTMDGRNVRV